MYICSGQISFSTMNKIHIFQHNDFQNREDFKMSLKFLIILEEGQRGSFCV